MAYTINTYHGDYNWVRRTDTVRYIVVHYTGAQTPAYPHALNNCQYFSGGNRNASAHYFIDEASIYEYAEPATKCCWHVGDGRGAYGITNQNSIGIEVCQQGDLPFNEAEIQRLAWLTQKLMKDFNVPAERVVRHYDASRKACPYYYTTYGSGKDREWKRLHDRITKTSTPAPEQKPGTPVNDFGLGYRAHVQNLGWLPAVRDGQVAGTTGAALRMEAFKIGVPVDGLVLDVTAHIQSIGDVVYKGVKKGTNSGTGSSANDPIMGTTGKGLRLEGFSIKCAKNTTGKKIRYRAHVQNEGWQPWKYEGQFAGTRGKRLRMEAIQIEMI